MDLALFEERLRSGDWTALPSLIAHWRAQGQNFESIGNILKTLLPSEYHQIAFDGLFYNYFGFTIQQLGDGIFKIFKYFYPRGSSPLISSINPPKNVPWEGRVYLDISGLGYNYASYWVEGFNLVAYINEQEMPEYEIQAEIYAPGSRVVPSETDYINLMSKIPIANEAIKQLFLFYLRQELHWWAESQIEREQEEEYGL